MKQAIRFSLLLLLVTSSLSSRLLGEAAAVGASTAMSETMAAAPDAKEDALYANGTKAMDEQRWADAVAAFDSVVAAKGKRVDAALYWKAYSLDKLGRKDEAGAVCGSLGREYTQSTWNKECRVLLVQGSVNASAGPQPKVIVDIRRNNRDDKEWTGWPATDTDIKILALNSLMQQDPAKGLPLLRGLILSDKPLELRKQALFVLSRSKQPEAQSLLKEIATNTADPVMQREAVQALGLYRGKDAGPTLVEIYRNSNDARVKRAAIVGLFLARDATRLVELARAEKDLNSKRDIVAQLALIKDPAATDYMLELLK